MEIEIPLNENLNKNIFNKNNKINKKKINLLKNSENNNKNY